MDKRTLVDEKEASRYIGMSVAWLRVSRCQGNYGGRTPAPPFYKIGRSVRYDLQDLDAWLETHRVDNDGDNQHEEDMT